MASSIPAAIDYLYAQAKLALPAIEVTDSRPGDAAVWLSIGVDAEDDETETEVIHADLAGRKGQESPVVPCMIRARAHDRNPDAATSEARTAAFAVFETVLGMIRAAPKLGGAVTSDAVINEYRVRQTNAPKQTGDGRVCRIYFTITWQHFL